MDEKKEKFTIIDEFDKEREAEIITVLESEGREYVVYSIDKDEDNCDVLVSRLVKNSDGTESVEDITDEEERTRIHELVNELLNA